jgi:hypothetical protein
MDNIKNWCSNKENIKLAVMIGMDIIFVFVLKSRFSGKAVITSDSAAISKETEMESLSQDSVRGHNTRVQEKEPAQLTAVTVHDLKPPPFLKRDLFSSRNPEIKPKREAAQMEAANLELTATIIDDQGALAIIGNEVLGIGEMVMGLHITAIKNNEVILSKGKRQHVLRIKEE